MRYTASFLETLGESRIELVSNCHSDAWPLLRQLTFRKLPVAPTFQSLPLAIAILSRRYCGDVFEFVGMKIGSDYADAIRTVLGTHTNIVNVDGLNRSFSTGELDVVVNRAGKSVNTTSHTGSAPLARIDWSGDFVDNQSRCSSDFAFGAVQTNASFFSDPFSVSVAIGLLFGRDRCGTLHVEAHEEAPADVDLLREALRIVGITLEPAISPRASARPQPAGARPIERQAATP